MGNTKQTERTDPHRPGAIMPVDYVHLLTYSTKELVPRTYQACAGAPVQYYNEEWTYGYNCGAPREFKTAHNGDRCCVTRIRERFKFSEHGTPYTCSICKASYNNGDVWQHQPTGECIYVGHTCADKYAMTIDRSEWERWHKAQAKMRSQAAKDKKFSKAREERKDKIRTEQPDLLPRLEALANHEHASEFAKRFAKDQLSNFNERGWAPTEKQAALLAKLETETANWKPRVEEVHVPAPTGRVEFTGQIVSIKVHESEQWGMSTKMTVKVTQPEGVWLAWLTVPLRADVSKGDTVTVRATLRRGTDNDFFAFGSRPHVINVIPAPVPEEPKQEGN